MRIYNSFVEGNIYTTAPSYHYLIVHKKKARHLRSMYGRVLFFDAVLHGQTDMVELGVVECPNRNRIVCQDVLDNALLFLCAQDCPSLDMVKMLVKLGADVNAEWNPSHLRKGTKDTPRGERELKKRPKRYARWLMRYMGNRFILAGDTPLILACRKRPVRHRTRESTSRLLHVTVVLKSLGAVASRNADNVNMRGRSAFTTALESNFFRVCFTHKEWFDPDLSLLLDAMYKSSGDKSILRAETAERGKKPVEIPAENVGGVLPDLSNNYVALSLLSAYAFETASFVDSLESRCAAWLQAWDLRMSTIEPQWRKGQLESSIATDPIDHDGMEKEMSDGCAESSIDDMIDSKEIVGKSNTKGDEDKARSTNLGATNLSTPRMRPLDETELVPFIAFLFLDAAKRGIMPNNTLTKSFAPNLALKLISLGNVQDVCLFLHANCSVLLTIFLKQHLLRFSKMLEADVKNTFVPWSELLYLAKCLYKKIWGSSLPEYPGNDEFMAAELGRELTKSHAEGVDHYMSRLKKLNAVERLAPLPTGWVSVQGINGQGFYLHIKSRRTSRQRPTDVGRSFA